MPHPRFSQRIAPLLAFVGFGGTIAEPKDTRRHKQGGKSAKEHAHCKSRRKMALASRKANRS